VHDDTRRLLRYAYMKLAREFDARFEALLLTGRVSKWYSAIGNEAITVPAGLALGISIGVRHDDWATRQASRWGSGNQEVPGYTELINEVRHDARVQLQRDVARIGGTGVVIATNHLRVSERECPSMEHARDHLAEVTVIGTAIVPFTRSQPASQPGSLAILSLDPQRRQAARVRLGP